MTTTPAVVPVFAPGMITEKRAYVVDTNQVAWWIDAEAQIITKAEVKESK